MKAAGAAGILGSGFVGTASAQCSFACESGSGPANCSCALPNCTFLSNERGNNQRCQTVDPPDDATHAVIKAGQQCHVVELSGTGSQQICVPAECQPAISHVEYYDCPEPAAATITVDCPNDQAVVDVENTDSVYYEVTYQHCDESDASGTLSESGDSWSDTVPLADCEGTIAVYTEQGGTLLDSADFDCETASVSVDCTANEATISATDTSEVW